MTASTYRKKPRSVSQLKQYERCPLAFRRARIDRVWKRPAAWTMQGIAVHAVAQAYQERLLAGSNLTKNEAYELFSTTYDAEVSKATEVTPNMLWWARSGPYAGPEDIERRHGIGLQQVDKLFAWFESHPEEKIWVAPDGKPGIELEFDFTLEGIQIRGFIDAVNEIHDPDATVPQLRVRDYKTGKDPGDDFQLAVYALALKETHGVDITVGEYWMARAGKPAYPFDLTEWPRERIAAHFLALEDNLQNERFDANPDPDKCRFCDVSYECPFAMG